MAQTQYHGRIELVSATACIGHSEDALSLGTHVAHILDAGRTNKLCTANLLSCHPHKTPFFVLHVAQTGNGRQATADMSTPKCHDMCLNCMFLLFVCVCCMHVVAALMHCQRTHPEAKQEKIDK